MFLLRFWGLRSGDFLIMLIKFNHSCRKVVLQIVIIKPLKNMTEKSIFCLFVNVKHVGLMLTMRDKMFMTRSSFRFLADECDLKTTYSQFVELKSPQCQKQVSILKSQTQILGVSSDFFQLYYFSYFQDFPGKRWNGQKYTTVPN